MALKKLDIEQGWFEANGVKYIVENSLSTGRFKDYEKLQHHIGFGVDFQSAFNTMKDVYEMLNKQKFADCAVKIHNYINGISQKLDDRVNPAFYMCTLFMNREGEDLTKWDEELAKRKIEDWHKEGYDVQDFFSFAVQQVTGLSLAYAEVSLSSLQAEAEAMNITTNE